jgi:hypothetical protein
MKSLIVILTLFLFVSCSDRFAYELEKRQLIASELNSDPESLSSFDGWQIKIIEQAKEFIPERSEINYVDKRGFIYFTLSGRSFAIKRIRGAYDYCWNVIIYPLSEKIYKKKK